MSWIRKAFSFREQQEGDVVKPFLDHLEDLRWTIVKMAISLAAGMAVGFLFSKELTALLKVPLLQVQPDAKLAAMGPIDGFTVTLTLAFYAGIILAFPFLLYFLAEFVVPALTRRERRLIFPGILGGFILFAGGVVICFHYIVPKTLHWFYDYSVTHGFENVWRVNDYYSFITHLCLACGLLAEVPIAMIALSAINLISYGFLSNTRAYAITLMLVLVAIISPTPDPVTFLTLAVPVICIYEMSIWIVWLIERRKRQKELSPNTIPE